MNTLIQHLELNTGANPKGSVIWMHGATQEHYQHAVPRSADRSIGTRMSITFRCLVEHPEDVSIESA